jgi:hypothetical protein
LTAEDSSEGFGFDSEDDLGDFGVFDSPGDEEFIPVVETILICRGSQTGRRLYLESLWQKYTSAEERLVTMGSLGE